MQQSQDVPVESRDMVFSFESAGTSTGTKQTWTGEVTLRFSVCYEAGQVCVKPEAVHAEVQSDGEAQWLMRKLVVHFALESEGAAGQWTEPKSKLISQPALGEWARCKEAPEAVKVRTGG